MLSCRTAIAAVRTTSDIYRRHVKATIYCAPHAAVEQLVPAVGIADGTSVCREHGGSSEHRLVQVFGSSRHAAPACADCSGTPHRAYFAVHDQPLCVRHAADAF